MKIDNSGFTSALYIWNGVVVFWGTSFNTNPHCHNSLQLVFDIHKEFKLKDEHTEWTNYSSAIIDVSHMHQFDSNESIQLFMYLDKESNYAKLIKDKYLSENSICSIKNYPTEKFSTKFFKKLLVQNNCDEMFKSCVEILQQLLELPNNIIIDKRVEKAIDFITKSTIKNFKVKKVASSVSLSESRLRHLFKEQMGQSIQNFILWMRVVDSLSNVLKGEQLNKTAYDFGFSDASHMTKSFIDLIGVPPSKIRAYKKEVKIYTCNKKNLFSLNTEIVKDWETKRVIKKIEI